LSTASRTSSRIILKNPEDSGGAAKAVFVTLATVLALISPDFFVF